MKSATVPVEPRPPRPAETMTDEQLAAYRETGYLQLDSFVSIEWLDELRAASAEFVERSFRIGGVPLRVDADGRHARPRILCWPQDLAVSPLVAYQATVVHDPRVAVPRDRDDVPVPSTVPAISAT